MSSTSEERGTGPGAGAPPVTVSVCMPTSRPADVLEGALASVLSQDFEDFEVLIGDETGEAEPLVVAVNDPRVRYYPNPHRLGFAANHVALLDRARGRYMTVQHDDDWWEPRYLSSLVAVLDGDPGIGLACCGTVLDHDEHRELWPFPLRPGRHAHVLEDLLREDWFLLLNATVWRRQVWTGAARQWPDLRCGDLQLFLSAAEDDWSLFYLPEPLAHWVQHDEQSGAWRGSDHGLGVADDVLAFWDGWLEGRPAHQVALTERQRATWHLRRARALLLAGRSSEARVAIRSASGCTGAHLPGLWRMRIASRLPPSVVSGAVGAKRRVGDRR
ncbi:MAG: glycosyltransferase family 2 protein [Acidimicrobiales bacterium]|nr:glycosyltransferase family 2 protein [Acidimicrobiales bacterium]